MPGMQQFKEIFIIWDECVEELKSVSNKLNKTDGKITRDVFSTLPVELKKEVVHPDMENWHILASSHVTQNGCIMVKISDLAPLVGIDKRDTLTPKLCKTLEDIATDVGYIIILNHFILD